MPLEAAKSEKENRPARIQSLSKHALKNLVCAGSVLNLGGSYSEQNEVSVLLELMS